MKYVTHIFITILLFSFILVIPSSINAAEILLEGNNTNLSGDDDNTGKINLGFNFDFFGNTYDGTFVNINGMLNFGSGSSEYSNYSIPTAGGTNNFIAAFWDDIITNSNQKTIYYYTTGTAPNRKFITQWTNMYFYNNPTLQMGTFQVILYEGSNKIQLRYLDLYGNSQAFGSSATVGIENSNGTAGVQYSYNNESLTAGQCITFTPSDATYSMDDNATCDEYRLYDANAPAAAVLTAPDDGANEESLIPTFTWNAANKATSYRILIATDANFSNILYNQSNISTTSYTPPEALLSDSLFYWRVQSVNSTTTALSDVRTFTTMHAPRASNLGPAAMVNGSYGTSNKPTVSFTLNDSVDGHTVKYQLQIDNNSNFSSPEIDYTSGLESSGSKSFTVGQASGNGSYTVGSEGQSLSDGSYYWRVKPIDSANAEPPYYKANSGNIAFRILTGSPDITAVSANPSDTSVSITWTTTQESSTQVEYGRVPEYGFITSESDTSPRVLSHTKNITNLTPCSRYFYRVKSRNAALSEKISGQQTFTTTGCVSEIVSGSEKTIDPSVGGNISYTNNGSTVQLSAPSNFANESSTTLQINRLQPESIPTPPPSRQLVQNFIYDFSAVSDDSTEITSFNEPLTLVISYGADVEKKYKESSLDLYLFNTSTQEWEAKGCVVDAVANTITCTMPTFSTYGVFGEGNADGVASASSGPGGPPFCGNSAPQGSIDVFQIDTTNSKATVHFTPVNNNISQYFISYTLKKDEYMYGVEVPYGHSSGAIVYTINDLPPNSTFYIQVRAGNGCASGIWSNQVAFKTGSSSKTKTSYFK